MKVFNMLVTKLGKNLTKLQYGSIFNAYFSYETLIAISQGDKLHITRTTHSNSTVKHKERLKDLYPDHQMVKQETVEAINEILINTAKEQGVD